MLTDKIRDNERPTSRNLRIRLQTSEIERFRCTVPPSSRPSSESWPCMLSSISVGEEDPRQRSEDQPIVTTQVRSSSTKEGRRSLNQKQDTCTNGPNEDSKKNQEGNNVDCGQRVEP
jgi:hypothetical protein